MKTLLRKLLISANQRKRAADNNVCELEQIIADLQVRLDRARAEQKAATNSYEELEAEVHAAIDAATANPAATTKSKSPKIKGDPLNKLFVYHWTVYQSGSVIVAAKNLTEASKLVGISRQYGSTTGNPEQIAIAMQQPGTIYTRKSIRDEWAVDEYGMKMLSLRNRNKEVA